MKRNAKVMYQFVRDSKTKMLLQEEKKLCNLFPNMTDEQIEGIAKLQYEYFEIGYLLGNIFDTTIE